MLLPDSITAALTAGLSVAAVLVALWWSYPPNHEPEIPVLSWQRTSVKNIVEQGMPVVLKGSPIESWAALSKWSPEYLSRTQQRLLTAVQASSVPLIDFVDNSKPLWDAQHWRRLLEGQWAQEDMTAAAFFHACQEGGRQRKERPFLFYNRELNALDSSLRRDLPANASVPFQVPGIGRHDMLLWMGCDGVTSRAHYDGVHNFYAQIYGRKRFFLASVSPDTSVGTPTYRLLSSLFSYLDPRARQSALRFTSSWSGDIGGHAYETATEDNDGAGLLHTRMVELHPGDVLYLPPYTFHEVTAVGVSVSVSLFAQATKQWDIWLQMKSCCSVDRFGDFTVNPTEAVRSLTVFLMKMLLAFRKHFPKETILHTVEHIALRHRHHPKHASEDMAEFRHILARAGVQHCSGWFRRHAEVPDSSVQELVHLLAGLSLVERVLFAGHYVEWLVAHVFRAPFVVTDYLTALQSCAPTA